jgi:type II secretory pathway pseudopilin PulG
MRLRALNAALDHSARALSRSAGAVDGVGVMSCARAQDEAGFTILETLVAMVILVVGLMGTMKLLDQANGATRSTTAREQGVALQRELVETARGLSYHELTPASVVGLVRSAPGFTGSRIGSQGWEVVRRGVTYHMTIGACSVDDPGDGIGTGDPATFCANGGGTTSAAQCRNLLGTAGSVAGTGAGSGGAVGDCGLDRNFDGRVDALTVFEAGGCAPGVCAGTAPDSNPDDFKRVVTLVRWSVGTGTRYALQSTTIPYPGFSGAPRVLALVPNPAWTVTGAVDSLRATVSTDRKAATVTWFRSGTPMGAAANGGGNVTWNITWPLGPVGTATPGDREVAGGPREVLDGTYEVSARAYDTYGAGGPAKTEVAQINRRAPYAPAGFEARRIDSEVRAAWQPSREGDVLGYELWRRTGTTEQRVCGLSRASSCRDTSLPSTGTYTYAVYAIDLNSSGAERRGDEAAASAIPFDNRVPSPPGGLRATRLSATSVRLDWDTTARDQDGRIAAYRVYRGGTALSDAIGTSTTTTFTDADAPGGSHTYVVAAVDDKGAESRPTSTVQA